MSKPTLVVINSNYPNHNNKYGDVFIHSRLKHYTPFFQIWVVGWKKKLEDHSFVYEGIHVDVVNTSAKLVNKIRGYRPSIIGFHFIEGWMDKAIIRSFNTPVFIWIHGSEALGWFRRLFLFSLSNIYPFSRYVARNMIQMFQMHNLISYANKSDRVRLIFVSNWMRSITEKDTFSKVVRPIYIPNPIDPSLFNYQEKTEDSRKKILLIRSFDSKKYANDIAIDAILKLSEKDFFKNLRFTIYGMGKYFKPLTDKIKHFENITLNNHFLENKDIPEIHKQHGVFLCPTRQDAQGVSMCEAMSSGLVPITSNNTAIPEFVEHRISGFMTESSEQIAEVVEFLYKHPKEFIKVSQKASEHIQSISSTQSIVSKEISLLMGSLD